MTARLDPQMMETPLTEKEVAVRDYFVAEYMKDFDPYRACIRMGFLAVFAPDQAKFFMADGYCLRKINWLTGQAAGPNDKDRAEMLENLRWLSFNGSTSSRATASKLYMEAQGYIKKNEDGDDARSAALVDALKEFSKNVPE